MKISKAEFEAIPVTAIVHHSLTLTQYGQAIELIVSYKGKFWYIVVDENVWRNGLYELTEVVEREQTHVTKSWVNA